MSNDSQVGSYNLIHLNINFININFLYISIKHQLELFIIKLVY